MAGRSRPRVPTWPSGCGCCGSTAPAISGRSSRSGSTPVWTRSRQRCCDCSCRTSTGGTMVAAPQPTRYTDARPGRAGRAAGRSPRRSPHLSPVRRTFGPPRGDCSRPSRCRRRQRGLLRDPASPAAGVRPPRIPARAASGGRESRARRAGAADVRDAGPKAGSARWSRPCAPPRGPPRKAGDMRVWIDLTNSPHVVIFAPLAERMRARGWEVEITARDFAQTLQLLELHGIEHTVIGHHGGGSRSGKARAATDRVAEMVKFGRGRMVSTSASRTARPTCRWPVARCASPIRRCSTTSTPISSMRSTAGWRTVCWCPMRFPPARLARYGARGPKLVRYPGLKEEYYLAGFEPDPAVPRGAGLGWQPHRAGAAPTRRRGSVPPVREPAVR